MFGKAKEMRDQKQAELEALGFTFDKTFSLNDLSRDELTDLSELQIGETTYIFESGDVARIA